MAINTMAILFKIWDKAMEFINIIVATYTKDNLKQTIYLEKVKWHILMVIFYKVFGKTMNLFNDLHLWFLFNILKISSCKDN